MTEQQIVDLILTNDKACVSALLQLYKRQTADEQESEYTKHQNCVGFNAVDAGILSSFAEQARKRRELQKAFSHGARMPDLSQKQMELLRKKLPRYRKQLCAIYDALHAPAPSEEPEAKKETCPSCNGEGVELFWDGGTKPTPMPCRRCSGEGGEDLEDGWLSCYHCRETGKCNCEECRGSSTR